MAQETVEISSSTSLNTVEIESLRKTVDDRLEEYFYVDGAESRLMCAVRHGLLSPGKRIRPLMTILACRQSGGQDATALSAACAVEMVHAASLVMDDLPSMDDARLRRGGLATHIVFGEGPATLAAIALLNESYRIISTDNSISAEAKIRSINHLTKAIGIDGLAGGQEHDIACGKFVPSNSVSLKEMEQRHFAKTGALFAAAAAIGGEIAGASEETVEKLSEYGCSLGLAYQAFDDVIDVSCTESETGKDSCQDQEKSTVVSLLGADGARRLAERHLTQAIECAQSVSIIDTSPLAELAQLVGAKFGSMTDQ